VPFVRSSGAFLSVLLDMMGRALVGKMKTLRISRCRIVGFACSESVLDSFSCEEEECAHGDRLYMRPDGPLNGFTTPQNGLTV
jgi:hypothetical protein